MDKKQLSSMIIEYWYQTEFLSQPDFPRQQRKSKEICKRAAKGDKAYKKITVYDRICPMGSYSIKTNDRCFLSPVGALAQDAEAYVSHTIVSDEVHLCLGKVTRRHFAERLRDLFGLEVYFPEKGQREVSLVGLKCTAEGRYVPGSVNVSPLLWGLKRFVNNSATRENAAKYLSVDEYEADMRSINDWLLGMEETKEGTGFVSESFLNQLIDKVTTIYFSGVILASTEVDWDGAMIYRRYQTDEVKEKDTDLFSESELFSGYFKNDLLLVEGAIRERTWEDSSHGQALLDYIIGAYEEANSSAYRQEISQRIDVQKGWREGGQDQESFFHEYLDITKAPLGKWPSRYRAGLMQQLAINMCWKPTENTPRIFSVNGPPGTGKTTLLKEIVAGNVVERACLLAKYKKPDEAFIEKFFQYGDQYNKGYSKYYGNYFEFKDSRLKDFGMLVASSNNTAVENITKELPDGTALLKGIKPEKNNGDVISEGLLSVHALFEKSSNEMLSYRVWDKENSESKIQQCPDIFFTRLAQDLLRKGRDEETAQDYWGLISAPLEKSDNVKAYINRVLKPYIISFGKKDFIEEKEKEYSAAVRRFRSQFDKVQRMGQELQKISGARDYFIKQRVDVEKEIGMLRTHQEQRTEEVAQLMEMFAELQQQIRRLETNIEEHRAELLALKKDEDAQEQLRVFCKERKEYTSQQIMGLERQRKLWDYVQEWLKKPTMLSKKIQEQYLMLKKLEEELQGYQSILQQLQEKRERKAYTCQTEENEASALYEKQRQLLEQHEICLTQIELAQSQIEECERRVAEIPHEYQTVLEEAAGRTGEQKMEVLDKEFFACYNSGEEDKLTRVHGMNPWHTAAYDREREKLFFEALRLHKAFLLGSKACLWNLKNLLLVWNEPREDDKKPVDMHEKDKKASFSALLNTVFLLTPVISTTFASVGNMLSLIDKPGEIGCLIVDEAGQASPHMALGALFRCRRAIVVGDPKQVEPVVTDEMDLIKKVIRNEYTQYYQDKTSSVQEFADRLNMVGTYYDDGENETWVGCPLVVHRRCISPMFEISNALSYNNSMKQQTKGPDPKKEKAFCREASGWINVRGVEKNSADKDHFVREQGEKAWELIQKAFQNTKDIPSLFVITPFTTVKNGLADLIQRQPEYRSDPRLPKWTENHVGTVHTFQGKEADEVIFLLGCDKNAKSAVRWVNANIINVAATRAKYRLYVIGDYTVWQASDLFRKVKGILDTYAIRSLCQMVEEGSEPQDNGEIARLVKQIPDAESLTRG